MGHELRSAVHGGYWRPPGPNFSGDPGVPWDHELAHDPKFHLHGLDPLKGSRAIKILASPNDELDGEEVEFVPHSVDHPFSTSSTQPLANRFQSQVIPSTPINFQPVLASIPTTLPPSSPSTSHTRPALNPAVTPSPIQKPRNSPITTSQQLQPMASSSRRRE
ncbi:hypothetical protein O181_084007 [Austropuccinia psidii MF-1]|uniref:Uncharacterized protein n=1 Tax=Austropuccinia psidii MF-1 TaxID=1389203 RepID=A0A9Q3FVG6_9BASI|nr:hypothetical protein [Austropuccinia psidii MF-1]